MQIALEVAFELSVSCVRMIGIYGDGEKLVVLEALG
jgi:hypothetical protein